MESNSSRVFAACPPGGVFLHLVQVMGQRALVVKKLAEYIGQACIGVPHVVAQQRGAQLGHGIDQQRQMRLVAVTYDIAEPLVRRGQRAVVGLGGRREPAFVDAASVRAKGVMVVAGAT